jgi:hypothetical protein
MERIPKASLPSTKKKMAKECENAYPPENTGDPSDFPEELRNRCRSRICRNKIIKDRTAGGTSGD